MKKSKVLGHIVALIVITCWGCTFVNTKFLLLGGLMPHEIFALRFLLAYICICIISPRQLFCHSLKDEAMMLLLGITGGSLYFLAENESVKLSFVNNVSFIVCTAPLLTTCLAIAFLKSVHATPRLIAGSLMAVCGVAIVIFNGHFVLHLNPLGDFLALVAASSWAIYSMLMKWATQRYNSIFITRKVFFYGLVTILPVFAIHPWDYPLTRMAQPVIWMNVLFLGIIASFACYALWTWAIGRIGALTTSNYVYLNPIATVVVSAIFLNEPMTAMAFIGSALILVGVYIANKYQKE